MIHTVRPSYLIAVEAILNRLPWENAKDIAKRIGFSPSVVRNAACEFGVSLKREQPTLENIKHFVTVTDSGCWEWKFCRNDSGYGQFRLNGESVYVHRHIWESFYGIKASGFICHKCDNPPCCNPEHLFLGNAQMNIDDAREKGRLIGVHRSKLTADQVSQIRALYSAGGVTYRQLGQMFDVCHETIGLIMRERIWKQM